LDLEVSTRGKDGCVIVRIRGECDIATTLALRESLLGILATQSARIVLDLSELDFLDCAGATALMATARRATLLGGALALAAPTAPVARLLRLTGLDQHLAIFPTAGRALFAIRPDHDRAGPGDRAGARLGTGHPSGGVAAQGRRTSPTLSPREKHPADGRLAAGGAAASRP
jgi:anti-anti-sigma factor